MDQKYLIHCALAALFTGLTLLMWHFAFDNNPYVLVGYFLFELKLLGMQVDK